MKNKIGAFLLLLFGLTGCKAFIEINKAILAFGLAAFILAIIVGIIAFIKDSINKK